MIKLLVIIVICSLPFIECNFMEEKSRARSARQISNAVEIGAEMASEMASTAAEATRKAINMGAVTMQRVSQNIMNSTQMIPGIG